MHYFMHHSFWHIPSFDQQNSRNRNRNMRSPLSEGHSMSIMLLKLTTSSYVFHRWAATSPNCKKFLSEFSCKLHIVDLGFNPLVILISPQPINKLLQMFRIVSYTLPQSCPFDLGFSLLSTREEPPDHPSRDIPRNAACVQCTPCQIRRMPKLITPRKRKRVRNCQTQRNDCKTSATFPRD